MHTGFVREWLAWHRAQGAEVFTLHDSGDKLGRTGDQRSDLGALLAAQLPGLVEVRPLVGSYRTWAFHQKMGAYDCALRHRATAEWLLLADLDEVLWSPPGQPLGLMLGSLAMDTSAVVFQYVDMVTHVCDPDRAKPLFQRLVYGAPPNPRRVPKHCVGGKYAFRPLALALTQLNTHAPFNRTRPACLMPPITIARVQHYHQLSHSGALTGGWATPAYCEEAATFHAVRSASIDHGRRVRLPWDGSSPRHPTDASLAAAAAGDPLAAFAGGLGRRRT